MPITIYTLQEFAGQHGQHVATDKEHGQRIIFEDGATSDGRYDHRDPPQDRVELLKVQRQFLKITLQREENNFAKCFSYIEGQAQYHKSGVGPAPTENDFDDLKRFKASVIDLRERLSECEAELKDRTPPPPPERVAARREEEMRHADEILSRLRAETADII